MRQKVRDAHPQRDERIDPKHCEGGLMDIEFAVQHLVLAHGGRHPGLQDNLGNIALLKRAEEAGLLVAGIGRAAADAYRELRRAQHRARLDEQPTLFAPEMLAPERAAGRAVWRAVFGPGCVIAHGRSRGAHAGARGGQGFGDRARTLRSPRTGARSAQGSPVIDRLARREVGARLAAPGTSWLLLAFGLAAGALVVTLLAGSSQDPIPRVRRSWPRWSRAAPGPKRGGRGRVPGCTGAGRTWPSTSRERPWSRPWAGARVSHRASLAWFLAWPLTQVLLALPPATGSGLGSQHLMHYGGLSGVLHAGVIVLGLALLWPRALDRADPSTDGPSPLTPAQAARHRLVGAGLVAGTLAKVLLESPWDFTLRPNAMLGIEVAPTRACVRIRGVVIGLGRDRPRLCRLATANARSGRT